MTSTQEGPEKYDEERGVRASYAVMVFASRGQVVGVVVALMAAAYLALTSDAADATYDVLRQHHLDQRHDICAIRNWRTDYAAAYDASAARALLLRIRRAYLAPPRQGADHAQTAAAPHSRLPELAALRLLRRRRLAQPALAHAASHYPRLRCRLHRRLGRRPRRRLRRQLCRAVQARWRAPALHTSARLPARLLHERCAQPRLPRRARALPPAQ